MALDTIPLPYGLRDIQLIEYTDLSATEFGTVMVDLPNAQTFSFTETEDYTELRGDDQLVTSHGQGANLDCELESGGLSMEAYKVLNGGQIVESGVTPNQVKRYRKLVTDQRPFIAVVGKAISDSGGDFWTVVYRFRATGDIKGEFADGAFMIPNVAGTGFPCNVVGDVDGDEIEGALYDFVQHETITSIFAPTLDTPLAPAVTGLSDIAGPTAGGEMVIATGNRFVGVIAVKMGVTAVTDYEVLSPTQIALITPAKTAGPYNVTVQNATGTSSTATANQYTYS